MTTRPHANESAAGSDRANLGLGLTGIVVASTVFVALLLAILYALGAEEWAVALLRWIEELGFAGMIVFGIIDALAVICLLPGAILTLGAGYLFGPVYGTLIIVGATGIGACVAFTMARAIGGTSLRDRLTHKPKVEAIVKSVSDGGWQTVLLTRLVPFFPFKLSNYVFGLTGVHFRDFAVGTFLGIIPLSITNVFAGSLASDIATAVSAERARPWWEWGLYGAGLVALFFLLRGLGRRAEAELAKRQSSAASAPDVTPC